MSSGTRTILLFAGGVVLPAIIVATWLKTAEKALAAAPESAAAKVATAAASEDGYCTPQLKQILRRVAGACGLIQGAGRGCKPADAKTVAALTGDDFNALFKPLAKRARIIQFDADQVDLDDGALQAVDQSWSDQRGASYFFVVSRASADGPAEHNQKLSEQRAEAVLTHLEQKFHDPELKQQVGLLWLGEEYAQLSDEFCSWNRSRQGECTIKDINRSAFIAWIDCAI